MMHAPILPVIEYVMKYFHTLGLKSLNLWYIAYGWTFFIWKLIFFNVNGRHFQVKKTSFEGGGVKSSSNVGISIGDYECFAVVYP